MTLRHVDDLRQQLVSLCALYGYELVETALVDDAEPFLTSASDAIVPRFYMFDQQGKSCVLRPEFTTAAMRRYLAAPAQHPTRWQFFDDVFERGTAAYYPRRSLTFGVELIDADGLEADAEAIALAYRIAQILTGSKQPLLLGHAKFVEAILSAYDLDPFVVQLLTLHPDHLQCLIADATPTDTSATAAATTATMLNVLLESTQYSRTMGGRNQQDIAERLMRKHSRDRQADAIRRAANILNDWRGRILRLEELGWLRTYTQGNNLAEQYLNDLAQLCEYLMINGIEASTLSIQPYSAKSWRYYTGVVFSIGDLTHPIISGGRYNELSVTMGAGRPVPAVGFSCHLDPFVQRSQMTSPLQLRAQTYEVYCHLSQQLRQHQVAVIPFDGRSGRVLDQREDGAYELDGQVFSDLEACLRHLKGNR